MNALLYQFSRLLGGWIFKMAWSPTILHHEIAERPGGCILAANHTSPFDVPILIVTTPRLIHWLSIIELFQTPWTRWFLTSFGALPLDRSKPDTVITRRIVRLLKSGCMVGMFPEGGLRKGADSVLFGGGFDSGVCGLAQLADVPVIPCVILGSEQFRCWRNWLPLRRTKLRVAYGKPISLPMHPDKAEARAMMQREIQKSFFKLREELSATL